MINAKAVRRIALFGAAFTMIAVPLSLTLQARQPMPEMLVMSDKLADWRARADQFDTVLVGTSRTFYHVDPATAEEGAIAAGCPDLNIYNFGVFGLKGTEQDWLISEILATPGQRVRIMIIEDPLPASRTLEDTTTTRAQWFSSPAHWAATVDNIASYPESIPKRIFRTGIFFYGAAFNLSGVGLVSSAIFPKVTDDNSLPLDVSRDGYEPLGSVETADIRARRTEYLSSPERFGELMKRYGISSREAVERRAAYLMRRVDALEARGLRAGVYISPDLAELDRTPRVGAAIEALDPDAFVFNFNRPDLYETVFVPELWHDFSHLLPDGAEHLSDIYGREICNRILKQGAER